MNIQYIEVISPSPFGLSCFTNTYMSVLVAMLSVGKLYLVSSDIYMKHLRNTETIWNGFKPDGLKIVTGFELGHNRLIIYAS